MKTSSWIFWGFWGSASLLVLVFGAVLSWTARAWIAPDGRRLRDITSLTGPWRERPLAVNAISELDLHGAFDVQWEASDTVEAWVSEPENWPQTAVRTEGERLVLESRQAGRFAGVALRVRIKSPQLSSVKATRSLKLRIAGKPGDALSVGARKALWMEGSCPGMDRLSLRTRGMTVLRMEACPVKELELHVEGRVHMDADVLERLEGQVHGDGRIHLRRMPQHSRLANFGAVRLSTD